MAGGGRVGTGGLQLLPGNHSLTEALGPARVPLHFPQPVASPQERPQEKGAHTQGHVQVQTKYLICDTNAGKLLWRRGSENTRFSNRCLLCSSHVTWNFFRCSFSWLENTRRRTELL